jgi:hypothetical protein
MHLPTLNLSERARALLAFLLFFIAWLLGNVGLLVGFEVVARVPAATIFAIACVLWWIAYKISRTTSGRGITLGMVALSVWLLNLVGALVFDFHHYAGDIFFWVATVIFLFLITAVVVAERRPNFPEVRSSPG